MSDDAPLTYKDISFPGVAVAEAVADPSLADTLHATEEYLHWYVVLTNDQAVALSLWVAHTHTIAAAECTPYIHVTSVMKRSGKTRLLEVLEPLVARPWLTGRTTAAVLLRRVDAERPTLLLDESDAAFGVESESTEALRGVLNTGYRASGKASLCVGQGANITYKDFSTFGPKCIAGIGELPPTVADRSIRIELKRKTKDEVCQRWRAREGNAQGARRYRGFAAWARQSGVLAALRDARPDAPGALGDRQIDACEPLLAIADLAGGVWPKRARAALVTLFGVAEDDDIVVELLRDIVEVLKTHQGDIIKTAVLLDRLVAREERPWREWRRGQPLSARGLARLLGPLGIHPDRQTTDAERGRGYRVDAFGEAVARYLPSYVSMCPFLNNDGSKSAFSMCPADPTPDTCKTPNQADFIDEMTHGHIDPAPRGRDDDEGRF